MILSFKPEMVDPILKGIKIHSIRKDKYQRWKPGMKIHFATGARTKNYKQFLALKCCSVQTIAMDFNFYPSIIMIDRKRLSITQKMQLVKNDGFKSYLDFFRFFGKPADDYIFMGVIIHWTGFRYHHKKGFSYGELPIVLDLPGKIETAGIVEENIYWSRFAQPGETKRFTREQLKEIRDSYKSDHAMDALRYGMMMPSTPKKVGLFGRLIAWIFGLIIRNNDEYIKNKTK